MLLRSPPFLGQAGTTFSYRDDGGPRGQPRREFGPRELGAHIPAEPYQQRLVGPAQLQLRHATRRLSVQPKVLAPNRVLGDVHQPHLLVPLQVAHRQPIDVVVQQ